MNPSLMTAWLAEVVIVSYRAVKQNSGAGGTPSLNGAKLNTPLPLPLPSTYLSTFIIYGTLGLIPGRWARPASLVGWGFVVATLLNLWTPGKANTVTVASSASNQTPSKNVDTGVPQIGK